MVTGTDLLEAKHVGIRELREHLSKRLKGNKPLIVTEHGTPIKVILSYQEMLNLLEKFQNRQIPNTRTGGKVVKKRIEGERYLMNAQGDPEGVVLTVENYQKLLDGIDMDQTLNKHRAQRGKFEAWENRSLKPDDFGNAVSLIGKSVDFFLARHKNRSSISQNVAGIQKMQRMLSCLSEKKGTGKKYCLSPFSSETR